MVRLEEHASKLPGQLSGGQQQRVAIARATVLEPSLVLMDEPLSNLDAKLRLEMRTEIRRLHQSLGLTTVYVTHDQEEALSMADRLVVMREGRVQQIGTPEQVHTAPVSWHVADFMGYRNLLPLTATRVDDDTVTMPLGGTTVVGTGQGKVTAGAAVVAAVRPEDVRLGEAGVTGLPGRVEVVEYQGRELAVEVVLPDGVRLHVRTDRTVRAGEQVTVTMTPGRLLVYPSQGPSDRPAAELASVGLAI
jgi:putative spermidine/putrescine transport system ATP-binding protein